MDNYLDNIKNIHLIGIGGAGMNGIAEYLFRKGYRVTGSDASLTEVTKNLQKLGIEIFEGNSAKNIREDVDLIVYTSAVKPDNDEYKKGKDLGIKMIKRAEMLGMIVNDKFLIAVSGTHGKTTTTAMISKVLIENNYDPTIFVGGNMSILNNASSRVGNSKYAIVEADEYDRSFWQLRPDIIVITNIESDHLDIYKDLNDIKNSFSEFIKKGKDKLTLVACGDDANVIDVITKTENSNKSLFYGYNNGAEYRIKDYNSFSYSANDLKMELSVFGKHNFLNSLAAYIVSKKIGITEEGFKKSISTFTNVKRRLELKYDKDIKVYDDYAHHPTEVKATLNSLKGLGCKKLIAIFQPHLYSRTRDFYKEFAETLGIANKIILMKIYPAREKEIEGASSKLIYDEIKKNYDKDVYYEESESSVLEKVNSLKEKDDVIVFMGAGSITNLCDAFVKKLQ